MQDRLRHIEPASPTLMIGDAARGRKARRISVDFLSQIIQLAIVSVKSALILRSIR